MTYLSRRGAIRSSLAAAFGLCLSQPLFSRALSSRPLGRLGADRAADKDEIEEFLEELKQSRDYTIECARAMPDAKFRYQPVAEVRSFGQQLVHIAEALEGLWELSVEEKSKPARPFSVAGQEPVLSKKDVIGRLITAFAAVEKGCSTMKDNSLDAKVTNPFGKQVSKRNILHFILDHTTHHRGQVVVYLRLNGIKPPEYRA